MIKNIYIIGGCLSLSVAFTSCNDFLDKLPDTRKEIKTADDAKKLLLSAYPEAHPAYLLEMYSDNADEHDNPSWSAADRFQEQAYNWQDITEVANQETPFQLWNAYYKGVATANVVLNHIETQANKAEYQAQKGEALVARAFCMFQLANVFCVAYSPETATTALGLPYPYKTEDKIGQEYFRGTLAELYQNIEKDLVEGLPLLGSNYEKPKFHFTPEAAYAFAARFYLYAKQYQKAVEYATMVLGDNAKNKLRDWKAWNSLDANGQVQPNAYIRSSEKANVFLQSVASEWGAVNGPTLLGNKYSHGATLSRTETLQATGPWGDNAAELNLGIWYANGISKFIIRNVPLTIKYVDVRIGSGMAYSEYPVFTTDETLLVRAEANALLGNYDAALADLNDELSVFSKNNKQLTLQQIKDFYASVAYYTPTNPTVKKQFHTTFAIEKETQEPLLQAILQLRRLVTIHQGLRLQDVKRYGITIYRRVINNRNEVETVKDSMTVADPRWAIQLPQDAITAGLPANPRNK